MSKKGTNHLLITLETATLWFSPSTKHCNTLQRGRLPCYMNISRNDNAPRTECAEPARWLALKRCCACHHHNDNGFKLLQNYKTAALDSFLSPFRLTLLKNNYIWNLKSQNTKGAWVAASLLPNLHLARRKNCQIAFRTIFQLQNLIRGALGTTIFPLRTMQLAIFLCFRFLMQLYFLYCSVVEPGTKCRCWSCHFSSTGRLGGLNAPALTFIGPR